VQPSTAFAGEPAGVSVGNAVAVGSGVAGCEGAALGAMEAVGDGDGGNGARLATALGAAVDAWPPMQAALASAMANTARKRGR
jgi:hypothetical protein